MQSPCTVRKMAKMYTFPDFWWSVFNNVYTMAGKIQNDIYNSLTSNYVHFIADWKEIFCLIVDVHPALNLFRKLEFLRGLVFQPEILFQCFIYLFIVISYAFFLMRGGTKHGKLAFSLGTRFIVFSGRSTRSTLKDLMVLRFWPVELPLFQTEQSTGSVNDPIQKIQDVGSTTFRKERIILTRMMSLLLRNKNVLTLTARCRSSLKKKIRANSCSLKNRAYEKMTLSFFNVLLIFHYSTCSFFSRLH